MLPLPADSAPRDSTAKKDTATKRDTVIAAFAQAEMPRVLDVGQSYSWDREALFNTGALTLVQVLDRVPGLTIFQSGWITSPQFVSYLGNPTRVRVYLDGVELIALGNSTSSPLDLASVAIWNVDNMTLERGVDELRIHLRSWHVTHTHTQSRVDIVTGDLGTNMLRAFFGKRWENGFGLQFGGQVYGTAANLKDGSGDANDLMLRFGYAQAAWSFDGYIQRGNGTRDPQLITAVPIAGLSPGIPAQVGSRTIAYLRGGYGRADSSRWWGQVVVNEQQVTQQTNLSTSLLYLPPDTSQVKQHATQLLATGGLNTGAFSLSAAEVHRWLPSGTSDKLSGRAALASKLLTLTIAADYTLGSGGITDAVLTFSPTTWLMLQGGAGYRTADSASGGDGRSDRIVFGARLGRVWFTGGAIQRDATVVPGLVAYDTAYKSAPAAAATGVLFSVNGKVIEDLGIHLWAVRWQKPGWYRPQLQERGEIYLDTEWRSHFPSGNFGLRASFGNEYRSDALFPTKGAVEAIPSPSVVALNSMTLFANIEIRVLTATLYFTSNWALTPRPYELVPQYLQPVQVYTYGLRWSFWN